MYDTHWGLTGRPFQLTPDPRFWFETATHRKAMAYLGYGLAQGEGFIIITGDIGAGKTTLVGHLLDTLDRQHLAPIKIVSTAIEADDLLRIVAAQLGVEVGVSPKAQLLTAIERGLHAVARTGRRTLLIVDEAQALPVSALEELRMLSNFQAGGHALLQIVLLGQPEFRDRLHGSDRLEQLRQRVIAIHHLDPMEEHEVADYIAHRLSVVGWTGRPDFAADAFAAFYRGSAGVPRRLNLLAGRVMLHAAIDNLSLIDADVVETVMNDLHADLPTMAIEPSASRSALPAHSREPDAESAPAPLPITGEAVPMAQPAAPLAIEPQVPIARPSAPGWFVPAVMPRTRPVPAEAPAAAAPEPAAVAMPSPDLAARVAAPDLPARVAAPDLAARVAALEERVEAQDAALRRVLTLLVDWVEADQAKETASYAPIRAAAAWPDAA